MWYAFRFPWATRYGEWMSVCVCVCLYWHWFSFFPITASHTKNWKNEGWIPWLAGLPVLPTSVITRDQYSHTEKYVSQTQTRKESFDIGWFTGTYSGNFQTTGHFLPKYKWLKMISQKSFVLPCLMGFFRKWASFLLSASVTLHARKCRLHKKNKKRWLVSQICFHVHAQSTI